MSPDLSFFESSIPVVLDLYFIFRAVGWGLLIGNCIFQAMKAMFSGLGFEAESPPVLLVRTGIYGFLLIFSDQICEIGLGIGKSVIELIGIPDKITLSLPDEGYFTGVGSSWLLVIIIGFVLGFQLLKLFLEIGERYAIVAILVLMCPVGFAMGGSKTTKEICTGYLRTFASMVLMMVMNVLFLKLILSGLATMPTGVMVLPWCVLLVGLVRVARKVDNIISKIGLSPAITGDPLGKGIGGMATVMAARTIISAAARGGKGAKPGNSRAGGGKVGGNQVNNAGVSSQNRNAVGGAKVGGTNANMGGVNANSSSASTSGNSSNASTSQNANNSQNSRYGATNSSTNSQAAQSSRFGSNNAGAASNVNFAAGTTRVNTNRFGGGGETSRGGVKPGTPSASPGNKASNKSGAQVGLPQKPGVKQTPQPFKGAGGTQPKKGQPFGGAPKNKTSNTNTPNKGQPGFKQNANPFGKPASPQQGSIKSSPKGVGPPPKPAQPRGLNSPVINHSADTANAPPPPSGGDSSG